jgi:hypothetical protein
MDIPSNNGLSPLGCNGLFASFVREKEFVMVVPYGSDATALQWKSELNGGTGYYIEFPKSGVPKVRWVVEEKDGNGPVKPVPVLDCTESMWFGPFKGPQGSSP